MTPNLELAPRILEGNAVRHRTEGDAANLIRAHVASLAKVRA